MKLSDHQALFSQHFALLVLFANSKPEWKFKMLEVLRTQYQQDEYLRTGRTKVKRSDHQDGLAGDGAFFIDGRYQQSSEAYRVLGEFWKSLDPEHNYWGGDWGWDGNHFGRKLDKIERSTLTA